MSRIEAGLHAHHASIQSSSIPSASGPTPRIQQDESRDDSDPRPLEAPFAKVNSVVSGSPADDAGLRAGDRIRSFGDANWTNHEKLSRVGLIVQGSEGVSDSRWLKGFCLPSP